MKEMEKVKSKGYTLVELLAVIIILGLLMTLGYTAVTKYLKKANDSLYEDFSNNIKSGASNYLIEHSGDIPNVGDSIVIDLEKLICEGYVKNLRDPNNQAGTCDIGSYAIVTRKDGTSNNFSLEYKACLRCSEYVSSDCFLDISGLTRLRKSSSCEVK